MKRPDRRAILRLAAVAAPSLALATVAAGMGGKVAARPSDLGGLAVDIELVRAPVPEASFSTGDA